MFSTLVALLGSSTLLAGFVTLPYSHLRIQQDSTHTSCNTTNIEWVLPGNFEEAKSRAKAEGRMLLIKGISFGVNEQGAKCATKGTW